MEWNVKNAGNRDVERQHLNKILKEIRDTYDSVSRRIDLAGDGLGNIQNGLTSTVTKIINNVLPPGDLATSVTLEGDVTGTSVRVPGQNAVTITTTLAGDYVEEAPFNSNAYWRFQGSWQAVPQAVQNLTTINTNGYVVVDSNGFWRTRNILSANDLNIVVTNPDGDADNTTIDLAEVTPEAVGTLQLTRFDEYGRRDGEAPATTDDLPEGTVNLYFPEAPEDGQLYGRQNATWQPVPAGGGFIPFFIPDGQVFTVPTYQQALYSQEIILDGSGMIVLEGILIEVL